MKPLLILLLSLPSLIARAESLRIDASDFGIPEKEVRLILESTLSAFPKIADDKTSLFVSRSDKGPITLHQRTPRGEIAILLQTRGRYFAQYVYQFAHELAHIRAQFKPAHHENKWLEEALCEAASLFALRQLSVTWRETPPSPALKAYRQKLYQYAQTIIASREKLTPETAPAFYQKHRIILRKSSTERTLNGALATVLLPYFEVDPDRWQTLATLPRKKGLTLKSYFAEWRKAAPEKHRKFLSELETLLLGTS